MICEIYIPPNSPVKRTLLLDRDNTLIKDEGYFHDKNGIVFLDNNFDYVEQLNNSNIAVFLVSNQSGIGKGFFNLEDTFLVNRAISESWASKGGILHGCLFCPHELERFCFCRKPSAAMLDMVISITGSKKSNCLFIGDSEVDSLAAKNAGIPFLKAQRNGIRDLLQGWI